MDRPRKYKTHLNTEFWLLLRREVLLFAGALPPPACTMALIWRSSWLLRDVLLLCAALVRRLDVGLPFEDAPLFRLLELRRLPCGEPPGGLPAASSCSSCATGRMQANMLPVCGFRACVARCTRVDASSLLGCIKRCRKPSVFCLKRSLRLRWQVV